MTISLRAVEPEDLEYFYRWENDRNIWQVSNTLVPFSRYQLRQYIESDPSNIFAHQQLRMMIASDDNKQTLGTIDLFDYDPVHQRAGIGILIASPADRGKGFAGEALQLMSEYGKNTLYLHQLYCNISSKNTASIHLFEKAGFKTAGIKKDWLRTGDGWDDEIIMQRLLND